MIDVGLITTLNLVYGDEEEAFTAEWWRDRGIAAGKNGSKWSLGYLKYITKHRTYREQIVAYTLRLMLTRARVSEQTGSLNGRNYCDVRIGSSPPRPIAANEQVLACEY